MERKFNRRQLLKEAAIITGVSTVLAACSKAAQGPEATFTPDAVKSTPTFMPTETPTVEQIWQKIISPTAQSVEVTKTPETPKFIYFSQTDDAWQSVPNSGKGSMRVSGCGVATGAMVTSVRKYNDPLMYWNECAAYYKTQGKQVLLGRNGTGFDFHEPVLTWLGFTPTPIEGKLDFIKSEIVRYTNQGVPVWINAVFDNVPRGHNSEAIGVDYSKDSNGIIVFNDPWYGPNLPISDRRITTGGKYSWKVYAIVPPAH